MFLIQILIQLFKKIMRKICNILDGFSPASWSITNTSMIHLLHLTIVFDFFFIAGYDVLCIDWHIPVSTVPKTFSTY